MTTSLLALAAAIAPVSLDISFDHPFGQSAYADSCFVAGTRVLLADYSELPIERIEIGDYVMGPSGGANRVVAIERPRLGARALHALGGGRHFVTAEHPFLSREGWKAIDPAATRAESPGLAVGRLRESDEIAIACFDQVGCAVGNLALAHPVELALAFRPVGRITACAADPSTRVYNLILDGDHAYFADGFLVHNKDGGSGSGEGSGSGSGGGSGSSGSSGGGGDGGSNGGEGGDSSGSSSSGGEAGDNGSQSGESSSSGGEAGESGSIGSVSQKGPNLTPSQEAEAISKGWQ